VELRAELPNITTYNCNGLSFGQTSAEALSRKDKLMSTLLWLSRRADVLALQETHLDESTENALKVAFPNHVIYFNSLTANTADPDVSK
jgi:exonuclease III